MVIILLMQCTQAAYAYGVSISWNGNTESDLEGYKVYYGTSTHTYHDVIDVGPFTSAVIDGLSGGVAYFFAVTAYDTSGNESAASQEVRATIPAASSNVYTLTITTRGAGRGTVTASPAGPTFSAGTTVTLTAVPDSNSTFAGWSGGYSGTNGDRCIVVMNANASISAAFNLKKYTITAGAGSGGSISPSGSISVDAGSYRTFVFTPRRGYRVSSVRIDGISISPVASYTFNNVRANHTIAVAFRRTYR